MSDRWWCRNWQHTRECVRTRWNKQELVINDGCGCCWVPSRSAAGSSGAVCLIRRSFTIPMRQLLQLRAAHCDRTTNLLHAQQLQRRYWTSVALLLTRIFLHSHSLMRCGKYNDSSFTTHYHPKHPPHLLNFSLTAVYQLCGYSGIDLDDDKSDSWLVVGNKLY